MQLILRTPGTFGYLQVMSLLLEGEDVLRAQGGLYNDSTFRSFFSLPLYGWCSQHTEMRRQREHPRDSPQSRLPLSGPPTLSL